MIGDYLADEYNNIIQHSFSKSRILRKEKKRKKKRNMTP